MYIDLTILMFKKLVFARSYGFSISPKVSKTNIYETYLIVPRVHCANTTPGTNYYLTDIL